jgi:hypothetical protein
MLYFEKLNGVVVLTIFTRPKAAASCKGATLYARVLVLGFTPRASCFLTSPKFPLLAAS